MSEKNLNDASERPLDCVVMRCDVTGNPSGTDTRPIGQPCLCKPCVEWLEANQQPPGDVFSRVLNDNLADLYEE